MPHVHVHGPERRRHPRLDHNIPLKISSEDADILTETRNLSCSGVFCRINKRMDPMTKLKIHLLLPMRTSRRASPKKVTCQGVVVRSEAVQGQDSFDTAIFFNDISPKDGQVINEFIERLVEAGSGGKYN